MSDGQPFRRIGLLRRGSGDPAVLSERVEERLGPLLSAFRDLPVVVEHLVYGDEAVHVLREQLLECDGVMVWVNPIQDGQTRDRLDALLREVSARGVMVSADPETILRLGTKEVVYRARHLPWGSDIELYQGPEDFALRFPLRLATYGQLVVKQARGNGGNGVWKVELVDLVGAAGGQCESTSATLGQRTAHLSRCPSTNFSRWPASASDGPRV